MIQLYFSSVFAKVLLFYTIFLEYTIINMNRQKIHKIKIVINFLRWEKVEWSNNLLRSANEKNVDG